MIRLGDRPASVKANNEQIFVCCVEAEERAQVEQRNKHTRVCSSLAVMQLMLPPQRLNKLPHIISPCARARIYHVNVKFHTTDVD